MTTLSPVALDVPVPLGASEPRRRDVMRAEWTKLRTIRSTGWTLLTVLVGTIAIGALICEAVVSRWDQMSAIDQANFDPTFRSLTGLFIAQIAIGVLGVLAITSEYATGMIRSTLAAVPARRLVLAAKGVALAAPAILVSTVTCVAAFLTGQAILATKGIGVSITGPGELRAVMGGGLYLTVMALFALGLGAIFRRTAGAVTAFICLVLVAPVIVGALPKPWGPDIQKYLPGNAGQAILNVHATSGSLSPWAGFAVLSAWAAAALALGAWLITHRDA